MTRFLQWIAFFILLSEIQSYCDGFSTSERRTYIQLFGRALRHRRQVSQTIRACQHFKVVHTDDPDLTDIVVGLHNSGKTKEILFTIAVSPAHYHHDSSVRKHKCLLSTWTEDANSYVTCKVTIDVWPNGLFFYNCSSYKLGQLWVEQQSTDHGTQIKLQNIGSAKIAIYGEFFLHPGDPDIIPHKQTQALGQGRGLVIGFPGVLVSADQCGNFIKMIPCACSMALFYHSDGRVGINYKGKCSVSIFHVCLKETTLVEDVKFDFIDGEIKECEHRKSKYSSYQRHWLPSLVGLNHFRTAVLIPVIVFLLLVNLTTLALKFLLLLRKYGSVRKAKREFRQTLKGIFNDQNKEEKNIICVN